MGDIFIEHLVKKKPDSMQLLAKISIIAGFLLICFAGFIFLFNFLPIIIVVAGFAAFYGISFFNIEYEYSFTNGELDIDRIYSKSRRKRVFTAEIKNFEVMCHASDKSSDSIFNQATTKMDCSTGETNANTYKFFINNRGIKTQIIFQPNEEMLNAFRPYLGSSKLKINK